MRTLIVLLAMASLLHADAPKNVVFLVADDLGLQLGCYGDKDIATPNIDALAAKGTRFTHAFASVASCSPSRATLLTGLPTHQCGQYGLAHSTHNVQTFAGVRSLPKLLGDAGWRTAVAAKLHVLPASVYPWTAQMNVNGRDGKAIADAALKFIVDSGDKPFFLHVGFTDPHRAAKGYESGNAFSGYKPEAVDPKGVTLPYFLPDNAATRSDYADYRTAIRRLDHNVGLMLDVLKLARRDGDTLVVFLSDNGMPFPGAKTTLYDTGVHLPLIVFDPSKRPAVNDALVSWTDLAPTVLAVAGVKPPASMGGASLLPLVGTDKRWERDAVFGSHQFHEVTMYYPMRMARTRTHKYLRNLAHQLPFPFASDLHDSPMWQSVLKGDNVPMGRRSRKAFEQRPAEELYDLVADPDELTNLAADPAHAKTLEAMRSKVAAWRKATNDPWLIKDLHE